MEYFFNFSLLECKSYGKGQGYSYSKGYSNGKSYSKSSGEASGYGFSYGKGSGEDEVSGYGSSLCLYSQLNLYLSQCLMAEIEAFSIAYSTF
jgi:hypothetical protein